MPQRGAQGCLHATGDVTARETRTCQENSGTRRRSSSGSCQERQREGEEWAELPLSSCKWHSSHQGRERSRATSTPHPFPEIPSPAPGFLLLTSAKPFGVLGDRKHVTHKGSATWRVPQQLFHAQEPLGGWQEENLTPGSPHEQHFHQPPKFPSLEAMEHSLCPTLRK